MAHAADHPEGEVQSVPHEEHQQTQEQEDAAPVARIISRHTET